MTTTIPSTGIVVSGEPLFTDGEGARWPDFSPATAA
jgi:hypothetical protein